MELKNIIADLDGTLAFDDHRRALIPEGGWTPYFEACDKDVVNPAVRTLLQALTSHPTLDVRIVILTGRCETVEGKTRKWLVNHQIPYHALKMRKAEDYDPSSTDSDPDNFRSDADVKDEMLAELGLTPENTLFVLDDRDVMLEFWRDRGYHAWQVRPEGKLY